MRQRDLTSEIGEPKAMIMMQTLVLVCSSKTEMSRQITSQHRVLLLFGALSSHPEQDSERTEGRLGPVESDRSRHQSCPGTCQVVAQGNARL